MTLDDECENFAPLSQSPIWDLQRSYYENLGIAAWAPNRVPNYVTTNPFIARAYAKVIDGFLEDFGQNARGQRAKEPHYIFELGAGSGRFAYGFLKHFFSPAETAMRKTRDIVYVMTDISEANIAYWRRHPQLKPYIDQGVLDFAYLDVMKAQPIRLLISERKITPGSLKLPLSVIGNYVIDSIPHDLYCVADGVLMARKVCHRIKTDSERIEDIIRNTEFDYRDEPVSPDVYENADWNIILKKYGRVKDGLNFSLPVGGLTAIDRLADLTTGPMFWLAGDFGASELGALSSLLPRKVARNGAYSLHVNFHAIAQYVALKKGRFLSPGHAKSSLEIVGILMSPGRRKARHLTHRFNQHIRDFGPDEFFMMKKIAESNFSALTLPQILALLRLSRWDAKVFKGCANALYRALDRASPFERQSVIEALEKVREMHFQYDGAPDPGVLIEQLFSALGRWEEGRQDLEKDGLASLRPARITSKATKIYL